MTLATRSRTRDDGDPPAPVARKLPPVVRADYRVGAPVGGPRGGILSPDAEFFCGSSVESDGHMNAEAVPRQGRPASRRLILPSLSATVRVPA